ncbi:MAG: hypothetical protein MJK04_07415 [Psychrosphaera sp.]|nr:hypothetical protein [Psychrosphaera sp.]
MDMSSENQQQLIEQYVTGLMDEAQASEFEAFILPKPDWQAQIKQARALFNEIHAQAWAVEVEKTRQLLAPQQTESGLSKWFNWPFTLAPTALAFAMGAVMVSTFGSFYESGGNGLNGPSGQVHSVDLVKPRSIDGVDQIIAIKKDVEVILLNVAVTGLPYDSYAIEVKSPTMQWSRTGFRPVDLDNLIIPLTGEFNNNELITIDIRSEPGGDVIKEYVVQIKEN